MIELRRRADQLVARYLDVIRAHEPVVATRLGMTDLDGRFPDLAPTALATHSRDLSVLASEVEAALGPSALDGPAASRAVEAERAPAASHLAARRDLEAGHDPEARQELEARHDLELLDDELRYKRFLLDVRPRYVLDPLAALETIAGGIHELLRWEDGDHEERCRRLSAAVQRSRRIPVLLEQAGTLLASAPAPHLDVATQRLPGLIALVRDELPRRAESLDTDVSPARDAGEVAAEGLEAYGALLDELSEEPEADWRLGPAQHAVTLRSALGTRMDPTQIEDRARTWIGEVAAEMAELAGATWMRRFPGEPVPVDPAERIRRTLDAVADTAIGRGDLVAETRRAVDEARAFAIDADLVDVPPADRLTVTEVPPYLRGIAVAFITQPPPLRPEAGSTFYLSPVPDRWDAAQARSFLREYNPAQLRSLAIHETYPGHFVQLEHASQHPRLARRLLTRPIFAEGWAVHVEREMLAAGFAVGDSSVVDVDDYRLTQRKAELRIATNALLDVGLHSGSLADDDALELLKTRAFQEHAEAAGKLTRAKVTSGQLCSYFVGGEEMRDLQAATMAAAGSDFDRRRFHQQVLSQGTPTVRIVAEALADDPPSRRPFAASA